MLLASLGSGGSDQSHVTVYQPYFLYLFFATGHCHRQDTELCGLSSLTQKGSYVMFLRSISSSSVVIQNMSVCFKQPSYWSQERKWQYVLDSGNTITLHAGEQSLLKLNPHVFHNWTFYMKHKRLPRKAKHCLPDCTMCPLMITWPTGY